MFSNVLSWILLGSKFARCMVWRGTASPSGHPQERRGFVDRPSGIGRLPGLKPSFFVQIYH